MAVYDLAHRRLVVRVVYDGPAGAGKTTNLRQLASAFASQCWGELETPEELAGRTLWFDWLQIRAGVVCGFPLVCQIISVPGQVALTPRRRRLLADADVVVVVVESTADAVGPARDALRLVGDLRSGPHAPPCVLQANKQDHVDALEPEALARAIGARADTVVSAIARDGVGVVDTFVAAVRHLSRRLDSRLREGPLRIPAARMEDAGAVLRQLEDTAIDPEGAAEMVLAEAAALLVGSEPAARPARSPSATLEGATLTAPLPGPDVPTGFIWPAHTGRATLRALGGLAARGDATPVPEGRPARIETGGCVLTTARRHQHSGPDVARQALVQAARERNQLERLLVAGTVLAVQEARDGTCWLWSIAPALPAWTTAWDAAADATERDALLDGLAAALVDGALLALRRGLSISARLGDFGLQGGAVRYVGELERCDPGDDAAARLLASGADAVATHGADRERFVAAVQQGLERGVGGGSAARAVAVALGADAA